MRILLVIDIQEKYLPYYDADLLSRVNVRISAAKAEGMPIFYVRNIGSYADDGSYALAHDLDIASDYIYTKKFPSAFTNDSFTKKLKNMDVTEIEIIGVDGNSCVKKTCLDAVAKGYKVILNLRYTSARNEKIFPQTLQELDKSPALEIEGGSVQ